MGYKSRGNFQVNCCLRKCANREVLCDECVRWSKYVEETAEINDELEKISIVENGKG